MGFNTCAAVLGSTTCHNISRQDGWRVPAQAARLPCCCLHPFLFQPAGGTHFQFGPQLLRLPRFRSLGFRLPGGGSAAQLVCRRLLLFLWPSRQRLILLLLQPPAEERRGGPGSVPAPVSGPALCPLGCWPGGLPAGAPQAGQTVPLPMRCRTLRALSCSFTTQNLSAACLLVLSPWGRSSACIQSFSSQY